MVFFNHPKWSPLVTVEFLPGIMSAERDGEQFVLAILKKIVQLRFAQKID